MASRGEKEMFIFTKDDKYVAMDSASGGYPYITDNFMSTKVWSTKKDAEDYQKMFKDEKWQLRKLNGLDFSLAL